MQLFDRMRLIQAEWYTRGAGFPLGRAPFTLFDDAKLTELATMAGLTLAEFKQQIVTPHLTMTCPLCGRPQTHLINCKGCGGDAWGWEFQLAHGEAIIPRLRQIYRQAARLSSPQAIAPACTSDDQLTHAEAKTYHWGGCMLCADCWQQTAPWEAYHTCPINLLHQKATYGYACSATISLDLMLDAAKLAAAIHKEWIQSADPPIAEWRCAILNHLYEAHPDKNGDTDNDKR